jgi:hypothetical protein
LNSIGRSRRLVIVIRATLNEDEELPESIEQSTKLKGEVIAQILSNIGIDAVNVGELDLVLN